MTDQLRLFIGIGIGDAWTARLASVAGDLREALGRSVRWVRPELYHVTVVFLGNQPPDAVPSITGALGRAASTVEPFGLRLVELRRLGGHERGALVAGLDDPDGALQRFRSRLEDELRRAGVAFDSKRLVPHITLGRPRGRTGSLTYGPVDLRGVSPLDVRAVDLVKSDLRSTGPEYQTLSTAELGTEQR